MKDNSSIIDEINTDHFPVFNRTILEATNFLGRFDEFSARTFNNFADYLTDAVMTGKASFKDFARSVLRDLASVIIRQQLAIATQRLFGGMGGTTNVLSTIGGAITGIFGRANGGTVQANKPYLIGERGAELFVPNTNGTVVPNNQMKSSGTNVNITINTVDARGIDELLTDRRSTIVNLINDALNSQGREALV
jgi:phage-related minor tail protein